MKICGNLIIFSTENKERKDVRKLKEKRLQVLLDENNNFPTFKISNKEYIKNIAEKKVNELFKTSDFYIEQLYTWGNPVYYTKEKELIVTYLIVINKNNIKKMPERFNFYNIKIENKKDLNLQKITLENEIKKIQYKIKTIVKRKGQSTEFTNKIIGKTEISELTSIILHTGIKRLRNRIQNTNIAFCFLDKEFSISELQQIYEIILDKKLVAPNFRKKIEPMIKQTEKIKKESAYRPSKQYTFNEEFIKNWV